MISNKNMKVNTDLQKERDTCTFNIEELTNYLDGGVNNTEQRRKIGTYFSNFIVHTYTYLILIYFRNIKSLFMC